MDPIEIVFAVIGLLLVGAGDIPSGISAYEAKRANDMNQADQGQSDTGAWLDLLVQLQAVCGLPAQGVSLATLCDWGMVRFGPVPNQFIIYTSTNLCDPNKTYQVYLMTDHVNVGYSFGDSTGVVRASKVKDAVLDALHAVNAACETGAVSTRAGN